MQTKEYFHAHQAEFHPLLENKKMRTSKISNNKPVELINRMNSSVHRLMQCRFHDRNGAYNELRIAAHPAHARLI